MDYKKIEQFLMDTGKYVLILLCGLMLTFNPEGATAAATKMLGWALVIIFAIKLINLAVGNRLHWGREAFYGGCCIAVGVILLARPLIIANLIGRTIGIILMVWGLTAIKDGHSKLTAAITFAAGLILVCIPASLTNALLTICGIIMVAIAVMNILSRFRERRRITGNEDPRIVDAEQ